LFDGLNLSFFQHSPDLEEYFDTCDVVAELEHCESELEEREHVVNVLRLQAVLKRLTKSLSTANKLVQAVKESKAQKVKNDWFTDYLELYHM
jgi:hypothetical protein